MQFKNQNIRSNYEIEQRLERVEKHNEEFRKENAKLEDENKLLRLALKGALAGGDSDEW